MLVQDFRMRNPGVDLQEAQKTVAPTMATESTELIYLDQQIPDLIAGLSRFKSSANAILDKLKVVNP